MDSILKRTFCVACEVCLTHRDHYSVSVVVDVVGVVVIHGVTRSVSDQYEYILKGCINFIQNFQKGKA